jgi:hypothetical protein
MTATYDCIATTTLGSDTASITFSTISGTYTDLVLVVNGGATGSDNFAIRFNSDTGTNYSATRLSGNGTTATSNRGSNTNYIYGNAMATTLTSNFIVNINNYANATTYKTALIRSNNAGSVVSAAVGLWRSTSAITSISIAPEFNSNLLSGTTATLYGIKAE